jgi:transcriptional antiterminator RfaH
MTMYWACAQTHPRQEEIALRNLRRQNYTSFFPFFLLPPQSCRNGNPGQYLAKPAFPGYVFVELDDRLVDWSPINFTLGIRRLLTYLDEASEYRVPCRADFVDGLRRIRILQSDRPGPDLIPVGTYVKIKRGAFAEKAALVEMSTEKRVGVMLEMFNQHVTVEFDVAAVERITRPVV